MKNRLKLSEVSGVHANSLFSLDVMTLTMTHIASKSSILIESEGRNLYVEEDVAKVFTASGYDVAQGDDVYLASHVLASNFITGREVAWTAAKSSAGMRCVEVKAMPEAADKLV